MQTLIVSPAGAGMHLTLLLLAVTRAGFPRRRGDAPDLSNPGPPDPRFPPQARGCTLYRAAVPTHGAVSPAGAGMHLADVRGRGYRIGFPRRRGDAPPAQASASSAISFPPQARGCTAEIAVSEPVIQVSPAGAGMHRISRAGRIAARGFPRRRGDAPFSGGAKSLSVTFPPQARGCTVCVLTLLLQLRVSPAGAGMHPTPEATETATEGFPRRRGDAPKSSDLRRFSSRFPPQARGCTPRGQHLPVPRGVSPAGAGMHPTPGSGSKR